MSQTTVFKKRKRSQLIEGAKSGVFGAFWGSLLFLCLHHAAQIAPVILRGEELFPDDSLADYAIIIVAYLGIGFLITFFISVIPAALAGVSNTLLLISVTHIKKFSSRTSVIIGIIDFLHK